MNPAFVVDCSIAMAWPFHDEATPETADLLNRLATETALVPAWWFIEITNVLAMAERKGQITPTHPTLLSRTWASSESSETMKPPIVLLHICSPFAERIS